MPAANTTVTANYVAAAVTIPYPVATHPRLWVTAADLPRLQSWATPGNPVYAQGMAPLLAQAVRDYNTYYFPGGSAASPYPDPGDTQGYGILPDGASSNTESQAVILAFHSLIDTNGANRILYAKYARNLLMYAMNQAALGHQASAPFRDPMFAVYNRANGTGEQWPLIVDWIYNAQDGLGNPILTTADKATIRAVFMTWANDCLNASTAGGDHPVPIGVTNSAQLLPNSKAYRMAANNYYLGHARLLTMMALSIDPSDDPAVNTALPASQLGNTLRSYILNANGAWLYQEFAMMGDPAAVAGAYGVPGTGAGFGLASGGLPPEGMLYGHSFGFILGQLLALQTAGFNNPAYSGPQTQLIGAPVWDRYVTGYLSSLTPSAQIYPSQPWLGTRLRVRQLRRSAAPVGDARRHAVVLAARAAGSAKRQDIPSQRRALAVRDRERRRTGRSQYAYRVAVVLEHVGLDPLLSAARSGGADRDRSAAGLPDHLLRSRRGPRGVAQRLERERIDVRLPGELGIDQPSGRRRRPVRAVSQRRMADQGDEQLRQQRRRTDHDLPQYAGAAKLERRRNSRALLV